MKSIMSRDSEVNQEYLESLKNRDKEKTYVVLYFATDEKGNEEKSWEVKYSRKDTYNFIKSMINYIDLDESKILVSGVAYEDSKNAYEFMKFASQYMDDPTFNIDDYYIKDRVEEEE